MENATQPVPLIELRDIRKRYGGNGTPEVEVLKGVSLSIHAGEFVAIVGASGSGKSTLMNILGCLDRPSSGSYHFAGHDVAELDSDEQAWLRREAFGFVFQGYHLIPSASAQENVEMPAIYAGTPASERHTRARALLERLGLAERTANRPHQLSGGQQQRVSIARALMNGGHIILADEPTGALDSHSGAEVMALLDELASQGHVVILITHDRDVAARAKRIIEVRDGEIVSDSANDERPAQPSAGVERHLQADDLSQRLAEGSSEPSGAWRAELLEAVRAAWRVMWINRFRTALTLLGIIIGVASVVVMLAVGEGSKRQVMAQMGAFGSNIIYLSGYSPNPRAPMGIVSSDDVAAIATLPQVKKVMPVNGGELVVRYGNIDYHAYVGGNNTDFPEILNWPVAEGSYFTERDEDAATTVAVIGYKQLPLLEQQAHEALITLATLIGEPVQALQVAERPFDSLRWPETGTGLPSELLSRRPDIANAEAQLAAAQADVQVARAALFPKLTLSASLSSGANRAADTFRNPYYNLGANLLAPIFNHGRLRAERDRSLARQEELLETYRKAILTAFADTERSLNSIDGLDRQLHWQQQELEQAQRAFDLSDSRYQAGAETLLTVLDTQRTLYAAQDAAVQLRLARLQASVGLYKALGGGWQSDRQGLARKD